MTQLGSALAGDGVTGAGDTFLGQRFRAAGLKVIGRTRSPEFAFNATTEPKVHGPTRNPYDLGRSVGGSSGGAGALVASRALAVAHATDGGGSIRIPASLCGIVGLKPTRERIPVGPGQWEGLHGMAHDFVLCRTLRDCAAMLDVLHGPAPGEKYVIPPPARPPRRGGRRRPGAASGSAGRRTPGRARPVDPEVRAATERVAVALAGRATRSRQASPRSTTSSSTGRSWSGS
ncbi:MAG: amidase family protein [Thermoleophilia bacterium]